MRKWFLVHIFANNIDSRKTKTRMTPFNIACFGVLTVISKAENHTKFKLRGEVTHVRSDSNWQSNLEVRRSKIKFYGGGNVIISSA